MLFTVSGNGPHAWLKEEAFERAANAFEALVRNGDPKNPDRLSPHHRCRRLPPSPGKTWLDDEAHDDKHIAEALQGEEPDVDDVLSIILNTTICRALAHFDFVLETGAPAPIETARGLLTTAVSLADNAENVLLWWTSNLCRHLIDDLWPAFAAPELADGAAEGTEEKYLDLRRLFISSLYARKTSDVELWPSQREAASVPRISPTTWLSPFQPAPARHGWPSLPR